MRIYLHDSKLRTNLDEIFDKNPLEEELVRPIYKFAKSFTKISSKVQTPKTYNEAINNFLHSNR